MAVKEAHGGEASTGGEEANTRRMTDLGQTDFAPVNLGLKPIRLRPMVGRHKPIQVKPMLVCECVYCVSGVLRVVCVCVCFVFVCCWFQGVGVGFTCVGADFWVCGCWFHVCAVHSSVPFPKAPFTGPPKVSLFVFVLPLKISFFFPSLGVFSLNFGNVFGSWDLKNARWALQTCISEAWALQTPPKFNAQAPERKTKREMVGPSPYGHPTFRPTTFCAPPFWASPF